MSASWGRERAQLLPDCDRADLSNEAFPFGTSRVIDIACARVRASRLTYVGELGWELYIPTEFAAGVFDALERQVAAMGCSTAGTTP